MRWTPTRDDGTSARALDAASERARGDAVWARMAGYDWLSAGWDRVCARDTCLARDDAGASLVIAATATIAAVVFEEVMRDGGW